MDHNRQTKDDNLKQLKYIVNIDVDYDCGALSKFMKSHKSGWGQYIMINYLFSYIPNFHMRTAEPISKTKSITISSNLLKYTDMMILKP